MLLLFLNFLKKICKAVEFCWSGSKFAKLSSSNWSARIMAWKVVAPAAFFCLMDFCPNPAFFHLHCMCFSHLTPLLFSLYKILAE